MKILIADDDFNQIRMIREWFSKRGHTVLEAVNGEEAIQVALEEVPDIVLLDVMMPVMNGWEVCKYLRSREAFAHTGIVMLTAIGPNLNEMTSPLYGADDFVDKP
ncbi:MAG: response regulator, partial [Deltaproteobacteria bacterium]|nr:response regulator [Deltaproteobacteria bacterium]